MEQLLFNSVLVESISASSCFCVCFIHSAVARERQPKTTFRDCLWGWFERFLHWQCASMRIERNNHAYNPNKGLERRFLSVATLHTPPFNFHCQHVLMQTDTSVLFSTRYAEKFVARHCSFQSSGFSMSLPTF